MEAEQLQSESLVLQAIEKDTARITEEQRAFEQQTRDIRERVSQVEQDLDTNLRTLEKTVKSQT